MRRRPNCGGRTGVRPRAGAQVGARFSGVANLVGCSGDMRRRCRATLAILAASRAVSPTTISGPDSCTGLPVKASTPRPAGQIRRYTAPGQVQGSACHLLSSALSARVRSSPPSPNPANEPPVPSRIGDLRPARCRAPGLRPPRKTHDGPAAQAAEKCAPVWAWLVADVGEAGRPLPRVPAGLGAGSSRPLLHQRGDGVVVVDPALPTVHGHVGEAKI